MRALVIGLGSMGRKRVPILLQNGIETIGFDPREDRRLDMEHYNGIRTFACVKDAMEAGPDLLVICSPPTTHMPYIRLALDNGLHSFAEDNVVNDIREMDDIIPLIDSHPELVTAPSCSLRFHPCVQIIRREVEAERIGPAGSGFFTYHTGAYLPEWHPYEEMKDYYVGSRQTGGGCDMITFDYDWLQWVFGRVTDVSCDARKYGTFDADVFDSYQLLSGFKSGAMAAVTIDVLMRWSNRYFRYCTERGEINWEYNGHYVNVYDAETNRWEHIPEAPISGAYKGWDQMQMYRDEIRHFLDAVEGKTSYCSDYHRDRDNIMVMLLAEESRRSGRRMEYK